MSLHKKGTAMLELIIEPILAMSYAIGVVVVSMVILMNRAVSLALYELERIEKVMRINDKVLSKKGSL